MSEESYPKPISARYCQESDTYVAFTEGLLRRYPGKVVRSACAGQCPDFDPMDPKYVVQ